MFRADKVAGKMVRAGRWLGVIALFVGIAGCSKDNAPEGRVGATTQAVELPSWAAGQAYATGAEVAYQGHRYRCRQQHTALAGWEPSATPALWEDLGAVPTPANGVPIVSCEDDPRSCCPGATTPKLLTSGDDTQTLQATDQCILALAGRDTLHITSAGSTVVVAGDGDDVVMGGPGVDRFSGGSGNDTLYGYDGSDELDGGAGDDVIFAGNGDNRVVPGAGRDTVSCGNGNDTVIIRDVCEAASGETLDGGGGTNTLVSPVSLAALQALGVSVANFQKIEIRQASCSAECAEQPQCSAGQVCAEGGAPGEVTCSEASPTASADYGSLRVVTPKGIKVSDIVLGASHGISVADGATVQGLAGKLATVAFGSIEAGANVVLPGVVARDGGSIAAGARVDGDLRSQGPWTVHPSVTVSGQRVQNAVLTPVEVFSYRVITPKPAGGDVLVRSGGSRIVWPGEYGNLHAEPNSHIYLRSGRYQFERLDVDASAQVSLETEAGWVNVFVTGGLELEGDVAGLGGAASKLFVGYLGSSAAKVAGQFVGSVVAPAAELVFGPGNATGVFYGQTISVQAGATLRSGESPWAALTPPAATTPPVADSGPVLEAKPGSPASVQLGGTGKHTVKPAILIEAGNAGNGTAQLNLSLSGGGTVICTYRGGASVAQPVTLLDRAGGRKYLLVSCSNGASAGTILTITGASLTVTGDPTDPPLAQLGVTEESCNVHLEPPIPLQESRTMIEAFSWNAVTDVPTTNALGQPALYYANIYVENKEDLALLQRLFIHAQKKPVFTEELRKYTEGCGTIRYEDDGEGMFVFAVIPGATYNRIRAARFHPDIPAAQRELFRAIILRDIPAAARGADGSLSYAALENGGFRYMGLRELPNDDAIAHELQPSKPLAALVDAVEFIAEVAKDVAKQTIAILGVLDWLTNGSVDIAVDLDVLNVDDRFADRSVMKRGWGAGAGTELGLEGLQFSLYAVSSRATALYTPIPTAYLGRTNDWGQTSVRASKSGTLFRIEIGDAVGVVEPLFYCYELQNDGAEITSFLFADEFCGKAGDKFGDFKSDHSTSLRQKSTDLAFLNEAADGFRYLWEMTGLKSKQAKVLTGFNANVISLSTTKAWAPCFGFGDVAADAGSLIVLGLNPVAGVYLRVLADADIIITTGSSANTQRGLMSHEYGHYALCSLADHLSGSVTRDMILTVDTIAAGSLDPSDDARLLNEAFADFFSAQIASGTNYFRPDNGVSSFRQTDRGMHLCFQAPCVDNNLTVHGLSGDEGFDAELGRLTTLMQDMFDGHAKGTHAPSSADAWTGVASPAYKGTWDFTSASYGDSDAEKARLGGLQLLIFAENFFDETNALGSYRIDALEDAAAKTLFEFASDCDACRVMSSHNVPASATVAEQFAWCAQRFARPDFLAMDPNTCTPCPAGEAIGPGGTCAPCAPDIFIDWSTQPSCSQNQTLTPVSASGDMCPDSFVVEVRAPSTANGLSFDPDMDFVTPPVFPALFCQARQLEARIYDQSPVTGTWSQVSTRQIQADYVGPMPLFIDERECRYDAFSVTSRTARVALTGDDLATVQVATSCDVRPPR